MAQPHRIDDVLPDGVSRLEKAGVPAARLTAEVLLSHALSRDKSFLYAHPEYELDSNERQTWLANLKQRCAGCPTQYITGAQEFFGLRFKVTPDVLIPRPETEILVEEALSRAADSVRVIDVGTGSGCVAIAIARNRPRVRVFASDLSRAALSVAQENAAAHGAGVVFLQANLVEGLRAQSFDIVVCNPPYVPLAQVGGLQRELRFEPSLALFGGENGLDLYRRLVDSVNRSLRPGGWLLLELGYNCRADVEGLLGPALWETPSVKADLAGIDRVLAVRRR